MWEIFVISLDTSLNTKVLMHASSHDCDNIPKEIDFHWKHELIFFIKVELVRRYYHLHLKKKTRSRYE